MIQAQNSNIKNQSHVKSLKMEVKYRTFYLSLNIIRFLETLPQKIALRIIIEQLIRCVTSIGANIVEAKASSSRREFLNYFQIALKSSNETKYWLTLLRELIPNKRIKMEDFIRETEEISKIIGSSILTIKGKR